MKHARRLLVIGLCAMSAGCAAQKAPEKIQETRNYNAAFLCDGGTRIQAHFTPYRAVLESQGMSVDMTQQPAADGFLYAGGGQSLRGRGPEAMWTDGAGAVHHRRYAAVNPQADTKPAR
jgi:hypothetical protein